MHLFFCDSWEGFRFPFSAPYSFLYTCTSIPILLQVFQFVSCCSISILGKSYLLKLKVCHLFNFTILSCVLLYLLIFTPGIFSIHFFSLPVHVNEEIKLFFLNHWYDKTLYMKLWWFFPIPNNFVVTKFCICICKFVLLTEACSLHKL